MASDAVPSNTSSRRYRDSGNGPYPHPDGEWVRWEDYQSALQRPGAWSKTDTGAVAGPKPINDQKSKSIKGEPAKSGLTTQAGLAESPNNRPESSDETSERQLREAIETAAGNINSLMVAYPDRFPRHAFEGTRELLLAALSG